MLDSRSEVKRNWKSQT